MQGGEATRVLAQTRARHGTTSLLATTMTAREKENIQAFECHYQSNGNTTRRR